MMYLFKKSVLFLFFLLFPFILINKHKPMTLTRKGKFSLFFGDGDEEQ